ncbi:hypothetical protein KQX54_008471 [Cotesia glomerata]|uniref:Uncharacterized protein n=1 Tax=Cotesia glomerata TaxID=32391 RepID=A0AAV7I4S3_COTGL|nr:hypothetical protein KQX54_008471 [Cotesia glomerata]
MKSEVRMAHHGEKSTAQRDRFPHLCLSRASDRGNNILSPISLALTDFSSTLPPEYQIRPYYELLMCKHPVEEVHRRLTCSLHIFEITTAGAATPGVTMIHKDTCAFYHLCYFHKWSRASINKSPRTEYESLSLKITDERIIMLEPSCQETQLTEHFTLCLL